MDRKKDGREGTRRGEIKFDTKRPPPSQMCCSVCSPEAKKISEKRKREQENKQKSKMGATRNGA
jgi:hypothetical protein